VRADIKRLCGTDRFMEGMGGSQLGLRHFGLVTPRDIVHCCHRNARRAQVLHAPLHVVRQRIGEALRPVIRLA